jgi:opacity protein-like surface antigen
MNGSQRFNGIRKTIAVFAILTAFVLGFTATTATADDIGGEDIVVPPPAAPPPPPPPPVEEDRFKLYLSGILGFSWGDGAAGGHQEFFGDRQKNTGSDNETSLFGGGALGLDADLGPVGLRAEIEGQAGRTYNSFKTPIKGVSSSYRSKIKTWAMFANLWMDIPITERFDLYLGGGIGAGVHDMKTRVDDVFTSVSHSDVNWAAQAGAGMSYDVLDWLTLDLGYRYVAFGDVDVKLPSGPGGGRSDLQINMHSHDLIFGVRMNYYSF